MRIDLAALTKGLVVLAVLALSFLWGFVVEVLSIADGREFWAYLLVMGSLVLLLAVALALILGRNMPLLLASLAGLVLGGQVGMVFIAGVFSPFWFELGGRDLAEAGGDLDWSASLAFGLILWGVMGVAVGAACGAAAWALRLGLRRMVVGR